MKFSYKTKGVCSNTILFEIENNILTNVTYQGGCHGNLQGICALAEGMDVDEVIRRVKGIHCGYKDTSCPDQLAKALEGAKAKIAKKAEEK